MGVSSVAVVLLLLCGAQHAGAQQNNFYGTVLGFYPKDTYSNRTMTVVLRYKTAFASCTDSTPFATWKCPWGWCGREIQLVMYTLQNTTTWCQLEGIMTRQVQLDAHFNMTLQGAGNWTYNNNNIVEANALTSLILGTRSDTRKSNSSPMTTIIPTLRVAANCLRNFNLLAFDPDGDRVECKAASDANLPSFLTISTNCTLSFTGISYGNSYAVQLTMSDFPKHTIAVSYPGVDERIFYTSDHLSVVPLQFVVIVGTPTGRNCTEGVYLPRFLPPTPANRAQLNIRVGHTLDINISTEATHSTVDKLFYSGPHNMDLTSLGRGRFILRWRPSHSEAGGHYPVCFVAQSYQYPPRTYQSDLRCVIISVAVPPPPVKPCESLFCGGPNTVGFSCFPYFLTLVLILYSMAGFE